MLRFAPSPTGDMHLGNLRVAILNYIVAQQRNENFLVRIEDSDKSQNIEGKDTEIMQILEKFALIHDSVFHQSEHLHIHQTLAIKLLEEEKAFVCTCVTDNKSEAPCLNDCISKEKTEYIKLKENKEPFVLRLKHPIDDISYEDIIYGTVKTTAEEIDACIILYADGTPSYNFASACGDMLSRISMVIDEKTQHLNVSKQIYIKEQLRFDQETQYAHIPLITQMGSTDAVPTVKWLFSQGYIPDAIINYLILLSNPKAPKKIFTLPEAIAWFKLEHVPAEDANFNLEKLRHINREHLRRMDDKLLSTLFGFADADVGKLVKLYLEEASTINELALKIRPIFAPKNFEGDYKEQMKRLQKIIEEAPMINSYDNFKNYLLEKSSLDEEVLLCALRLLLTGSTQGPELNNIYPLIKSYLLEVAS